MIRLNIVDTDKEKTAPGRYLHKAISTGLPATRKNKAAAEAMLTAEIEKYNLNSDLEHMSLTAFCERWLQDKNPVVEVTTVEGYEYRIRHIKDFFEDKALARLEPADIRTFYQHLVTVERRVTGKTVQGYSNRTIKDTAVLLSEILADAVTMGLILKNPAEGIKIPQRPASRDQRAYLAADQVATFRQEIKGHRLEVPFLMALLYGMRREEILGLKWVAIRDGKIYIENTVSRVRTIIEKDRAKTAAGYRAYPITPEIQERLEEIKKQQAYYRREMGKNYRGAENGYVFTWEDGHPYSPDYITKSFKKLVRRSEILDSNLTLHSLRASCVSILIHAGMDLKDTQVWIGHSDVATTMGVYARTNERQQKIVAATMERTVFADDSVSVNNPVSAETSNSANNLPPGEN